MAGGRRWWRNGAASLSHGIPHHGPSTTIPRASGATAGQNSFNGSWPTPANYADRGTRSRCTISAPSKTSTPRGRNTSPNGSRGWLHATARPSSSAVSATRTSTPDVLHADHDEHRRASCYGKRARLVRRGAVGKGPGQLAPRRRPTLPQVRFCERRGVRFPPPTLLAIMVCGTRAHADALWGEVAAVLAPLGLRLSETKTRVCHIDEGFDFLGFRIQRRLRKGTTTRAVYTYPSKKALLSVMAKVRALTGRSRHLTLEDLLRQLNLVLRGWSAYFRHGVSKATFGYLDAFAWHRVTAWLRKRHKGIRWKDLYRRYLTGRPGNRPAENGVIMFDTTQVEVTRY